MVAESSGAESRGTGSMCASLGPTRIRALRASVASLLRILFAVGEGDGGRIGERELIATGAVVMDAIFTISEPICVRNARTVGRWVGGNVRMRN
jgi:hypothetical protein